MQERNYTIDIYKGLGIFLIVLGHLETSKLLNNFIFMFHVPAFFFIAGMTFRIRENETFAAFLGKKAYRLLLPYACFTLIISITQIITNRYIGETIDLANLFSVKSILLNILDLIIGGGVEGAVLTHGPAWFLYALFIASILFYCANRLRNNKLVIGGGITVLYFLSIKTGLLVDAPLKLGQSIAAVFFMWCGQSFKDLLNKYQVIQKPVTAICGAVFGFIAVLFITWRLNDSIDMAGNYYPSAALFSVMTALVGCVALYMLSLLVGKLKLSKVIVYYGVNSMFILGLHIPLRNVFRLIFSRMGLTAQQSAWPIFLLVLLVSVPLIGLVNKYIPFLVGMKQNKNK